MSVAESVSAGVASADFAERRLYRLMSLSLGITAIVEVASIVPAMIAQTAVLTVAYTATALGLILIPSIVGLAMSAHGRMPVLRRVWRIQAVGMLAAYALLPVGIAEGALPEQIGLTWVSEIEVVAGCAAVLAWGVRGVIAYMVGLQAVVFTVALQFAQNLMLGRAFADALRQFFFVSMFVCLAIGLFRAGRMLDATIADAVREARVATAIRARRSARDRVQMLVHDSIIVALIAYAGGMRGQPAAEVAASALDGIERGVPDVPAESLPEQLAWRLQALTTRVDPHIAFDYRASGQAAVPAEVSAAFEEALSEALRNSMRHASDGRPVTRQVRARLSSERGEVVVLDDGRGFDPAKVDATRLGVRHGILRRMRAVPGGTAEVHSRPGRGTTVTLSWSRP